jgi:hypothetical protein
LIIGLLPSTKTHFREIGDEGKSSELKSDRHGGCLYKNDRGVRHFRHAFSVADVVRYQRRGFKNSVQLLVENHLLVLFPEGYPNIDPACTPRLITTASYRSGEDSSQFARAAERRLGASLPIIPTSLQYSAGKSWKIHVRFSEPINSESFASGKELIR